MGLDMYLIGEKYFGFGKKVEEDGFQLNRKELDLGYWRKHPNLHGYIVNEFAEGEDNCQRIELSLKDLEQIIEAIKTKSLPVTTGFFFGVSDESDDEPSIEILNKAIQWLSLKEEGVFKTIYYEASW